MLPKMAFTGFTSRYREPRIEEGFQDITKIDFRVSVERRVRCTTSDQSHQFEGSEEQKTQWSRYWIS